MALIDELPPDQRAAFRWFRPTLRQAFDELLQDALDDEAVERAIRRVLPEFARLAVALHKAGGRALARLAEASSAVWQRSLERATGFLDPASADLAEWAARAVMRMSELALVHPDVGGLETPGSQGDLSGAALDAVLEHDSAGLLRAQVLLIALFEAAESDRAEQLAARMQELAERAFLAADAGVEAFEAEFGISVDPYAGDSLETRNMRARRSIAHAREILDERDIRVLEGARLSVLR